MKKVNAKLKRRGMIFLLLVFCLGQVFAADCGDVSSDGNITIVDALLIAQHYVNLNPDNFDPTVADVSGDGIITIVDALLVSRFYVGLITEFPGCAETPAPTTRPTPDPSNQSDPFANSPVGFASLNGGTTGGEGGQTVTVSNQSDLERYAGASEPYIIKVQGTITLSPLGWEVNVASNKTIVGVGSNATISKGGFRVINNRNVIIRNLIIKDSFVDSDPGGDNNDNDGVQTDGARNIWVDHCLFTHHGDGVLDIRKDTSYITVSWCLFTDNKRGPTFGWTEVTDSKVTLHHCWIRNMEMRNPVFDQGYGHFYNNYSLNVSKFGHQARGNAKMLVENSYWDNVNNPYGARDSNSIIEVRNPIVINSSGTQSSQGGTAFDPSSYYSYHLDPTEDVPDLIRTYAGPSDQIRY